MFASDNDVNVASYKYKHLRYRFWPVGRNDATKIRLNTVEQDTPAYANTYFIQLPWVLH